MKLTKTSSFRAPLSNRSNLNASTAGKNAAAKKRRRSHRTSCIFADAPTGCMFKTTFEGKYYGKAYTAIDVTRKIGVSDCMSMVKRVIAKNSKNSTPTTLAITDQGIDFQHAESDAVYHHIGIEDIFKVVPGTIVSKSGKTYTVAIVIQYDSTAPLDQQPCHVLQCAHREDAKHMHTATKRMYKDHIFSNLLDVSTEEAQEGFDSFMIRQDMEIAAARCTELIKGDEAKANDRCSLLIQQDLRNSNFLDFVDCN